MRKTLQDRTEISHPRWANLWIAVIAGLGFWLLPDSVRSLGGAADLSTLNADWNGLSKLAQQAGAIGVRLHQVEILELDSADSTDGLLIIHPTTALPTHALSAFMRRGGRVAILDDFGTGQELLSVFSVRRTSMDDAIATPHLRGRRELAIATPVGEHPLSTGVEALVTNHPQVLHHPQLDPVFSLGDNSQALALTGAVGEGRLVAVGDSSVVINNMMEFPDNRRFARNLIRYLAGKAHGEVLLVSGGSPIADDSGLPSPSNPVAFLRAALQQIARRPPNVAALHIATWAIAVGLLLAAIAAMPQRSTYEHLRNQGFPEPTQPHSRASYADALLDLDRELRAALEHALRLPIGADRRTLVESLARRSRDTNLLRRTERLLSTLDFHRSRPLTRSAIHVSARRFRKLAVEGKRIVEAIRVGAA